MWIPASVAELEALVSQGALQESASLDCKREVPGPGKSKDIARDVAAMANEGGVLIFGVGEDEHKRATVLSPVPLVGEAERISNILRSGISDPPTIEIREFILDTDPALGYLVVVVPPSPRAPHMVVIGGENRFYGRSPKGNALLNEGEVARLYERRNTRQGTSESVLDQAIASAPIEPNDDFGYLHVVAKPSPLIDDFISMLSEKHGGSSFLSRAIRLASEEAIFPSLFSPGFSSGYIRPTPRGWIIYMHDQPGPDRRRLEYYVLDLEVLHDGIIRLFCGRAAERRDSLLFIFDVGIAETVVRFLTFVGHLYRESNHLGPCDLGVAITGISGAVSLSSRTRIDLPRSYAFEESFYRRTIQVPSLDPVQDARVVARKLLSRFFHATLGGTFDPLG